MLVLAFDTATEYLSVCLRDSQEGVLCRRSQGGPLRHGANLVPLLLEMLPGAPGRELSDVDLIACAEGPGSFTGLRIGFATARGLSASREGGIPLVAVPTLELLAWRRRDFAGDVLPLLDARKGRFYTALFRRGARLAEDQDLSPDQVVGLAGAGPVLVTGFHAQLLEERLSDGLPESWTVDPEAQEPAAAALAERALDAYEGGLLLEPGAGPRYVRRSDAEIAAEKARES